MNFNKLKLLELMVQLTDEQQGIVMDYIEKTAAANMALKKLSVYGDNELDLEKDAGNIGFSGIVSNFAENTGAEFDIFHTIGKRFCKKDFGGATEAEMKANIDAIILKKGTVIGRYYIRGAYLTVELDYAKPEADGKYMIQVSMETPEE